MCDYFCVSSRHVSTLFDKKTFKISTSCTPIVCRTFGVCQYRVSGWRALRRDASRACAQRALRSSDERQQAEDHNALQREHQARQCQRENDHLSTAGQGANHLKQCEIELRDTLQANTTYTIDLGDAVQDNNEGNPLENLSLTFSTGDHIDTMKVMGTLLNAKDLEPVTGAFVGIYALNEDGIFPARGKEGDSLQLAIDSIVALYPDSIFSLRPFERAGKTDSYGRFTISGVGPGKYRMYAVKDGNTNYMYDVNTEDIAFVDSLIIPSVGSHTASDTIWNRFDSLKVDSIYVHEVTDYYPNDLCLRMFNEGHVIRYLDDMKWKDSTQITLNFAARMPEPPVITLLDEEDRGPARLDKDAWLICEPNPTNDTLVYWLRDSLVYHRDTLHLPHRHNAPGEA